MTTFNPFTEAINLLPLPVQFLLTIAVVVGFIIVVRNENKESQFRLS